MGFLHLDSGGSCLAVGLRLLVAAAFLVTEHRLKGVKALVVEGHTGLVALQRVGSSPTRD